MKYNSSSLIGGAYVRRSRELTMVRLRLRPKRPFAHPLLSGMPFYYLLRHRLGRHCVASCLRCHCIEFYR